MKSVRPKILILLLPLVVIAIGIFILNLFDPFYSYSSDPEFPYLVNGLNCAQLNFNWIGHIDHPGTPFQVYNGIIIRITHLFSGKGNIAEDVFTRPEHYMNAISVSQFLLQAFLIYLVGTFGIKRRIPVWQLFFLQAAFLFSNELFWLFTRVNPDRFFMITGLIFFLIYLKHGYENSSPVKFALWSGTAMALGLATKLNFLPILFLPFLFIGSNKNRLIYIGSVIVSFFIFILPIIDKFKEYREFILSIFQHDGLYGTGESKVLNFQKMIDSTWEIFRLNPELILMIGSTIILLFISIRKRKVVKQRYIFFFAGFLFVMAVQIIMVSKHFKNYYLAPTFMMYGFMFFISSMFLAEIIGRKNAAILLSSLLPIVFLTITLWKSQHELPAIKVLIAQREKIMNFVDSSISKDDIWFVEPTWEPGPYKENAIVYGLSYCAHRDQYFSRLKAINPNIITYEGNPDEVRIWRCGPAKLDSVVATRKNIYLYSNPERNANILLDMLRKAGSQKNLEMKTDTVFSDADAKSMIIRVQSIEMTVDHVRQIAEAERKIKIEGLILNIKNSPDWLEKVRQKAIQKNISLDSMILLDAIYMFEMQK